MEVLRPQSVHRGTSRPNFHNIGLFEKLFRVVFKKSKPFKKRSKPWPVFCACMIVLKAFFGCKPCLTDVTLLTSSNARLYRVQERPITVPSILLLLNKESVPWTSILLSVRVLPYDRLLFPDNICVTGRVPLGVRLHTEACIPSSQ